MSAIDSLNLGRYRVSRLKDLARSLKDRLSVSSQHLVPHPIDHCCHTRAASASHDGHGGKEDAEPESGCM